MDPHHAQIKKKGREGEKGKEEGQGNIFLGEFDSSSLDGLL